MRCIGNLFDMFKINQKLKKWQPDVGFNPWSNGLDSCYFLTYCKKFHCYKDFNRPDAINHYQVIRRYMQLLEREWKINKLVLKSNYQKILICPQSTDPSRAISSTQLDVLISDLNNKYQHARITIASMDESHFRDKCNYFIFRKSSESSQLFIDLIKGQDLVVCSDSGPLHVANALDKDVSVVFRTTEAKNGLNANSLIYLDLRGECRRVG